MSAVCLSDLTTVPELAGAIKPPRSQNWLEARRSRKQRLFPFVPDHAFDEGVIVVKGLMGGAVLVNDPAGVKQGLIDNVANYPKTEMERRFFTALFGAGLLGTDGEVWRRHRRIMAPAFDPRSVTSYGPAITRACEGFQAKWDALSNGAEVDVPADMSSLTLRIIAGAMFSADTDDVIDIVAGTMKSG